MTAGTDPSLSQAIVPVAAGEHVVASCWLKGVAAFATVGGTIILARDGESHRVEAHPGAGLLSAAGDGARLLTGGDDGRVAETRPDGSTQTLAETKGGWIDALALNASGAFAFATGRRIVSRDGRGTQKTLEVPSTARGLAFAPKGYRLAASHYNGATLWFPNVAGQPEILEWKGSHLDVTWSPDARFVVTSMQENALHGWRLQPDKGHMRMSGYPAKTRSLSWSHDGKWLGTSGAEAAIIWPFESRDGPMGKAPRECGVRPARVSRVAFHPGALVLAAGYEDGCLLLIRLADASELLVRAPFKDSAVKDSAVTALAWDAHGRHLAFGCANGDAGVLTLPA
jgi:WD40 repeat protein